MSPSARANARGGETDYSAKDITVLEGLEAVRKRPGMYIGGVDADGLHHLVWEILDNAVDEAMNGHASTIDVTLHRDGSVSVRDDGRGIPVDLHRPSRRPAIEVILTTLHAGGKFERGAYRAAGGLHGVGASVVNALSASLTATVWRSRKKWRIAFARGKRVSELQNLGPARGRGTEVRFLPDPQVFDDPRPDADRIAERLEETSFLHRGVLLTFTDEERGETRKWRHERGLRDYFEALVERRKLTLAHEAPFEFEKDPLTGEGRLELALGWTESPREDFRSYVNGIPTGSGGSHEAGLREGLARAVRQYLETGNRTPRGLTVTADDAREGVLAVLSVFLPDPRFQGQTKDRLNNPEIRAPVDTAVRAALEKWLHQSPTAAERITGRVVLAARSREASRAAIRSVRRRPESRARTVLPGKLSDCASRDPGETEIFIVEGDSAGGSAKQARDRVRQAVLPLRGKILNAAQATPGKVAANAELRDIGLALGCGTGDRCRPDRLRYRRIILLADADADGHHITTLLLAYFVNYLWPLLAEGRVYVAQPPLFRLDFGGEVEWAADDAERDRILGAKPKNAKPPTITRFKGLGEMPPRILWNTTLNPKTRNLLQVEAPDPKAAKEFIEALMGRDPAVRRTLIRSGAPDPAALDL